MVEPDRSSRPFALLPAAALLALLALIVLLVPIAACTPKKPPETVARAGQPPKPEQPEKPPVEEASAVAPAPPAPQTPPPPPEAVQQSPESNRSDRVVVIDPGEPDTQDGTSLVEAARLEKQRRAQAGKPVAVINDKTLSHYAKGQITFADPKPKDPTTGSEPGAEEDGEEERERFWRAKVLEVRRGLRDAAREAEVLEEEAAALRRRFYGEDDPFVRDGEIKPEWDRTLDRLRLTRERMAGARHELEEVLEEGRRAGALPGWLREGAENEPAPEKKAFPGVEPGEPQVLQEGPGNG
jgi:hypothetical protein